MDKFEELILIDPETNRAYTLRLSSQDVKKAKSDMVFANALLRYAQSLPPRAQAAKVGKTSNSVAPQAAPLGSVPAVPTVHSARIPSHTTVPTGTLSNPTRVSKASGLKIAPAMVPSKTVQVEKGNLATAPSTAVKTNPQHATDDDAIYNWSKAQSRLLIALYKGNEALFGENGLSQKQAWEQISVLMAEKGHIIPGRKCDSKFQSLKRTYKSVRDHNNKSGNSKRTWEYFESIFKTKPWIEPLSTAGSDDVNCDDPGDPTVKPKTVKSKQADYLKDLLIPKKERAAARDVQHKEKLNALADLRDLMRQHLNQNT